MKKREVILQFLEWNDRNGCYTDEDCKLEGVEKFTESEAIKYFFDAVNGEVYYKLADNICELTDEEVINFAKEQGFYKETINKLNRLVNEENPTSEFYYTLLK